MADQADDRRYYDPPEEPPDDPEAHEADLMEDAYQHRKAAQEHQMDDLIDFRVSDTWRDWYASRGMTYPSGRPTPAAPMRLPIPDEAYFTSAPVREVLERIVPVEPVVIKRPKPRGLRLG